MFQPSAGYQLQDAPIRNPKSRKSLTREIIFVYAYP
jgi:hypothetical protein